MTGETKTCHRATAFTGNLIAILILVVIGFPLAPATIRTMILGWILVVAAITRFILRHHFQPIGCAVTLRPTRVTRRPRNVFSGGDGQ